MARKNQSDPLAEAIAGDKLFKSYKNTGKGDFTKLVEGEEVSGVFLSLRLRKIKDRRTKLPKMIRVYNFMGSDGKTFKIGSRALLDSCFDDIMDEHGGMDLKDLTQYSGPGIDWITNRTVKIIRGEDTETTEGDDMGTYEILVEEDTKVNPFR